MITSPPDLTPELVALVQRFPPDQGPEPHLPDPAEATYWRWADELAQEVPAEGLWLFAYGSLIWNPDFEHEASLPAVAPGWHRAFCFWIRRWRGTREMPGLMMGLDRGGSCRGIAYRLPDRDHRTQIHRLLDREIDADPPTNAPRWIMIDTPQGRKKALSFVANHKGAAYSTLRDRDQVAAVLAQAAGHWGSCAEYLQKTVTALQAQGIVDRGLWDLQRRVAAIIRARFPQG